MTKLALSEKVGVSNDSIRRWEDGTREPRASDITKLCKILGVTEAELLNGPAKEEFKINFVWEVEDMNVLSIGSNEFNFGFRGNDVLVWGAFPDDTDEDGIARIIAKKIRAARIGKAAVIDAEKKLNGDNA